MAYYHHNFQLHEYILTVKHDNGKVKIKTVASSETAARTIVENAEHCPPRAIIKVIRGKLIM